MNFTVAQTVFNESVKSNIVPIPWNATTVSSPRTHLSRQAVIGISIGCTVFAIFVATLMGILCFRWRRKRASMALTDGSTNPSVQFEDIQYPSIPLQEMAHQSIQELHNISHHIELLDGQTPSGSGNHVNEIFTGEEIPVTTHIVTVRHSEHRRSSRGTNSLLPDEANGEDISTQDRIEHITQTANPHLIPHSNQKRQLSRQDPGNDRSTDCSANNASTTRFGIDLNKALPQSPPTKAQKKVYHPVPWPLPISSTIVSACSASKKTSTRDNDSMVLGSENSSLSVTYATVFDIDEYSAHHH